MSLCHNRMQHGNKSLLAVAWLRRAWLFVLMELLTGASPGGRPLFYEGHKTRIEDAYDNRKSGSGQAGVFHQGALVRSEKEKYLVYFLKSGNEIFPPLLS